MTDSDLAELSTWADAHAPAGSRTAALVRSLLAEHLVTAEALTIAAGVHEQLAAALRAQTALSFSLADRVAAQSALLSRRAARSEAPSVPIAELLRLADDGCPLVSDAIPA